MDCHLTEFGSLLQNLIDLFTELILIVSKALFLQLIDPCLFLDNINDYQIYLILTFPVPPFSDDIASFLLELLHEVPLHHQTRHGSLYLCGMNLFDAVNYGFVTIATGGYGTHSAVLQEVYHSKAIEYTLTFFMFMAGVNYTLIYYSILKGKIGRFFHDAELRCYLIIILGVTAVCTNTLFWTRIDGLPVSFDSVFHSLDILEKSFRDSIFTVVSLQTTTGLANCD